MGKSFRVGQIIDDHDVDPFFLERRTKNHATYPTETIDCNS
jgi:hypothetical protein